MASGEADAGAVLGLRDGFSKSSLSRNGSRKQTHTHTRDANPHTAEQHLATSRAPPCSDFARLAKVSTRKPEEKQRRKDTAATGDRQDIPNLPMSRPPAKRRLHVNWQEPASLDLGSDFYA